MQRKFLKNSLVNLFGGASAAAFNLALPALLVRYLSSADFLIWNLVLQVLIHVQLFGFGIQSALTRFTAIAYATRDNEDQKKTLNAGLLLVAIFATFAAAAVGMMLLFYPLVFSKIPESNLNEFRVCLGLIGISAALQLFALVPAGYFIGQQKNYIPVFSQIVVRIFCLCAVWFVINQNVDLVGLAVTFAGTSLLLVPISYIPLYFSKQHFKYKRPLIDIKRLVELLSFCGTLATWNLGMLLVLGLSTLIVGYYDFEMVTSYSLASVVVAVLVGIQHAIMSPLLATGSTLFAENANHHRLAKLLNGTTAACIIGLLLSALLVKLYGLQLLEIWLGAQKGREVYPLLLVLLVANIIRNSALPYSLLLMAVNQQKIVRFTALAEGLATVLVSIILANKFGAIGVAYGALIGAFCGLSFNFVFNFKKTRILVPDIWKFSLNSLSFFLIPLSLLLLHG